MAKERIDAHKKSIWQNIGTIAFFSTLLLILGAIFMALLSALSRDPQIREPTAWPMMLLMLGVIVVPMLLVMWVMRARGKNIAESRAEIKKLKMRGQAQQGALSVSASADSAGALSASRAGALELDEHVQFDFDAQEATTQSTTVVESTRSS